MWRCTRYQEQFNNLWHDDFETIGEKSKNWNDAKIIKQEEDNESVVRVRIPSFHKLEMVSISATN